MDRKRFKRPEIQTQSQTTKIPFGNPQPVPKGVASRPFQTVVQPVSRPMINSQVDGITVRPRRPNQIDSRSLPAPITSEGALLASVAVPTSTDQLSPRPSMARALGRATGVVEPQYIENISPTSAQSPQTTPIRPITIDMELPGQESISAFSSRTGQAKWRLMRRGAARSLALALVLLITMGGLLFSQSYLKLHKVFKGSAATAAALKSNVDPNLLNGEGRGRVNVLLLGRGGGTHDGPDLTDTMMIASIDPVNHTSTLLSIPRDLWVNVPNLGAMKINAAWESGEFKYLGKISPGSTNSQAIKAGFDVVDQTVEGVFGITVDYNLMVDFQAFRQAVDTVGGVNINVPTDLVDPTMAWENANNPILAKAGPQVFDGTHALTYVRSRETTSDFARAERQRSILLALKGKVVSVGTLSNPLKISGLLNNFGNNVQTDLSIKNANRLYDIMKNIGDTNVASLGLADGTNQYVSGGNINGQAVVLPKAGLFKYDAIQQYVRFQLKDPYIVKENARIMVLNGSTTPGLATTKANELKSYGYNVTFVGNTPHTGWTASTLVDLTHSNKYTKNYLEQRFNQKASTNLADTTIPTNGADFVIIVGSDEAFPTQH